MTSHPLRSLSFLVLLLSAGFLPATLRAQTAIVENRVPAVAGPISPNGPRLRPPQTLRLASSIALRETPQQGPVNVPSNVVLMGIGAAGVVVGSIIGGDDGWMIALGSGVIGLIGLYRYLR